MTIDIDTRLLQIFADEAAHHDALAAEMAALARDGCGPEFAHSLRAIARNHRIRAIELRSRIAALKAKVDG